MRHNADATTASNRWLPTHVLTRSTVIPVSVPVMLLIPDAIHDGTAAICQGTTSTFCTNPTAGSTLSRSPNLQCLPAFTFQHTIQYLMLWAYTLHLQHLCQFVQTTMEVIAELHQILDVIHSRKVDLQRTALGSATTLQLKHDAADEHWCRRMIYAENRQCLP